MSPQFSQLKNFSIHPQNPLYFLSMDYFMYLRFENTKIKLVSEMWFKVVKNTAQKVLSQISFSRKKLMFE